MTTITTPELKVKKTLYRKIIIEDFYLHHGAFKRFSSAFLWVFLEATFVLFFLNPDNFSGNVKFKL